MQTYAYVCTYANIIGIASEGHFGHVEIKKNVPVARTFSIGPNRLFRTDSVQVASFRGELLVAGTRQRVLNPTCSWHYCIFVQMVRVCVLN